jgi:sugar phosphate isomerase/epimerase
MRVGVFSGVLRAVPLDQALDYLAKMGVECVELGTGCYPDSSHCPVDDLLGSRRKRADLLAALAAHGLQISALNCAGNPLHPNRDLARSHHSIFRKTLRLAAQLEVDTVINFSGCPGDHPGAKYPNWVTCAWPTDYREILDWQWTEVVLPYWSDAVAFARKTGVSKIALEMHPGFVVYNPETLVRLRRAVGPEIGANFDPSHLFWQGIEPCAAVRELQGAIWHVHAKDTAVQEWNVRRHGVLDAKSYKDELNRAWIFRTVGYGHSREFWCNFVSSLRMAGYDGVLSLEHEDSLMNPKEGLEKGLQFLQSIVLHEPKGGRSKSPGAA